MYYKKYILDKEMEPMTLGSPPASPSTSPAANPNFLPAFLLGESQTSSPSKTRNLPYKPNTPGIENRGALHQKYYAMSPQQEQPSSATFNLSAVAEKSGPPSRGLFDTVDSPSGCYSPPRTDNRNYFTSPIRDNDQRATPQRSNSFSRNLNESLHKSCKRPIDNSESLWVTVLGFPPHAASLILSQFAQCGTILDKKFPPEGNWVHLKFSSQYETAKALSFNGKLISNSIMIGVLPCNTIIENKENASNLNESLRENLNVTSPNRARPLVQSFIPKQSSTEVLSPQNIPQKSTGLVSKAMEYVFGW